MVVCCCGTTVAAYVARRRRCSADEALAWVVRHRYVAAPNEGFVRQLRAFVDADLREELPRFVERQDAKDARRQAGV